MKSISLIIFLTMLGGYLHAGDILTLTNQKSYQGKVTKIKDCQVIFKLDGDKFTIPANDIYSIEFENKSDKIYLKYLDELTTDPYKCVNGRLDAAQYHGKKSAHIALGFLFGPFAMLGTAMSKPSPHNGQLTAQRSNHAYLFDDPEYLDCYRKRAKGKLIGAESIGFGISVLMILLITPTYLAGN